MQNLVDMKINSLDDSLLKRKKYDSTPISSVQFDSQHKESQIEAWKVGHGRKKSKTTEYLYLEAISPINPRDSIFFSSHHLDCMPQFDLVTYSNRSSINAAMSSISIISEQCEPESDDYLQNFTNKRESVGNYKRSSKHNQ